jgi:hypothetical protein
MSREEQALQDELLAQAVQVPDDASVPTPTLLWTDPQHPEREMWTRYLMDVVTTVFPDLDRAKDIRLFCPKYEMLTKEQRIVAWSQLFTGISFYESSFNPSARGFEAGEDAGIDDITHLPVWSEGLLQLSYQDETQDSEHCTFDWKGDQRYPIDDVRRSIHNPYRNLYCGVHIMANEVDENHGKIIVHSNYYWSTLQKGNFAEDRSPQIERMVQQIPYCGITSRNPFVDFFQGLLADFGSLLKFIPFL